MKKTTFGKIVGNRGFFPDALAKQRPRLPEMTGNNQPDVRLTERDIQGKVTIPLLAKFKFRLRTKKQRPASKQKNKEK